jgi:hypothetical protein
MRVQPTGLKFDIHATLYPEREDREEPDLAYKTHKEIRLRPASRNILWQREKSCFNKWINF